MELVWPSLEYVESYAAALRRDWSADTMRPASAGEELAAIDQDADAFVRSMVDREATGGPITLPDGTLAPRLPGYRKWMWDGEFCGSIGFRWQPGTAELPPYCLGHIGYSVVPWKQRRGYATTALRLLLDDVRAEGLPYVVLTTHDDNIPSQRVIEANRGRLEATFAMGPQYGGSCGRRFVIDVPAADGPRPAPLPSPSPAP